MFEWIDSQQRCDSLMLSSVSGLNLHPGEGLKGHRHFAAAARRKSKGNSEDALGINVFFNMTDQANEPFFCGVSNRFK